MEHLKIKNPFQLFPQEIWEVTLDQMEDSKDILTVLRGIPKLDISISKQKRFWLIGEILPSLYNLINQKDVLNLRLVCKDWQRRVDHFLQNQPYYRAYSEDLHKDNPKFWAFLEKHEINSFNGRNPFRRFNRTGPSLIIDKLLEHPRNPFVFREIEVDVIETDDHDFMNTRLRIITSLQRLGTHVWYLSIKIFVPENKPRILNLVELLKLVPNLKGLAVIFLPWKDDNDNEELSKPQLLQSLPELPFLETLILYSDMFYSSVEIGSLLLNRYGRQLRRIVTFENYWNEETSDKVPKLTELDMKVGCYEFPGCIENLQATKHMLCSIRSPNLVKLEIWFCNKSRLEGPVRVEQDILTWLKRFPSIKYFRILSRYYYIPPEEAIIVLEEEGTVDPVKDLIPSLQTLKIVSSPGLSYNFLRCFPSLQDLEIRCHSSPTVEDLSIPDSGVKLREQIQTGKLYESNIWEVLPKLRKVCLAAISEYQCLKYDLHERSIFYRETYEKLKLAGTLSSEPELHAYRNDVRNFISQSAMDN